MKPAPFAYTAPHSLPEALEMLAQHGEEGKLLAGGQSLVPLLNMRLAQPTVLIDLNEVEQLRYLRPEVRAGRPGLAVGAMTRQRATEEYGGIDLPLLHEALGYVGHAQIRNRGTIGGSIAHADPAAELPLVFLTLDGIATVQGQSGRREVPAGEFFQYTFTTAVGLDELLIEVWLPLPAPRTGQAFVEVARRHGDFALVSAAACLTLAADHTISGARLALGGAAPVPLRVAAAEEMLIGHRPSLALFREAAGRAAADADPTGDVHADEQYRREVAGTLAYRALKTAWERIPKEDA